MPNVPPLYQDVSWPPDEGVLGIIGVAPWATIDFLKILYSLVPALKDWHYPRVLLDINSKLPSRGRYFELGERDPSPYIRDTIRELAQQGATTVVIPCNTAHLLYDKWSMDSPVPIINIVDAVISNFSELPKSSNVIVLASDSIQRHGLYTHALHKIGLEPVPISNTMQGIISKAIQEVKQTACISPTTQLKLEQSLLEYKNHEVVGMIIGCTELSTAKYLFNKHIPMIIESNQALAIASLQNLGIPINFDKA